MLRCGIFDPVYVGLGQSLQIGERRKSLDVRCSPKATQSQTATGSLPQTLLLCGSIDFMLDLLSAAKGIGGSEKFCLIISVSSSVHPGRI
jgi:hypothetical protein